MTEAERSKMEKEKLKAEKRNKKRKKIKQQKKTDVSRTSVQYGNSYFNDFMNKYGGGSAASDTNFGVTRDEDGKIVMDTPSIPTESTLVRHIASQGNTGRTDEELARVQSNVELSRMTNQKWKDAAAEVLREKTSGMGFGALYDPDTQKAGDGFDFAYASQQGQMANNANVLIQNWDNIPEENKVDSVKYLISVYGINDQTKDIILNTYNNASTEERMSILEDAVFYLGSEDPNVKYMQGLVAADPNAKQIADERVLNSFYEDVTYTDEDGNEVSTKRFTAAPAIENMRRQIALRDLQEQRFIDEYVGNGYYTKGDAVAYTVNNKVSLWWASLYDAAAIGFVDMLRKGQEGIEFSNPLDPFKAGGIGSYIAENVTNKLSDLFTFIGIPVSLLSKAFLSPEDVAKIEDSLLGVTDFVHEGVAYNERFIEATDMNAVERFGLEVLGGTIEMVPGIVAGIFSSGLGLATFGTGAAGANARSAYENGATLEESVRFGLVTGVAEVVIEKMFMGFGFMGKGFIAPTLKKIIPEGSVLTSTTRRILDESGFTNSISARILKGVVASGGEATEEMVMEIVTPYIERTTYDPEAMNATWKEVLYAGGLGAAIGGILGIPVMVSSIANEANKNKTYDEIIDSFRQEKFGEIDELENAGEITPEQAASLKAETEDILSGKGSLNVSDSQEEVKVTGEALDTVYDSYEEAKKAMMQEARTKKDGEKITANYIDNGVVKTFSTTAKGGTLGLGRSTEAGKEYQRIAQAQNVTERSGYQLNVKEEIIKEVSALSKAIGREVEFYRNEDASDHGYMDKKTGKIYINAESSQSAARSVIAHELTHQMENTAGWNKLVELMKKHYGSSYESRRQERIDAYEAFGKPLKVDKTRKTYDEADQELVAMFVEEKLLTDADTIREVVNTDKTLAQKIIAWINKVIQKLAGSKEQKMLVKARDLWNQALKEEQSGNKKAPKEGAGERHSFGGVNARTADLKALENAKDMLAKNHSAVDIFRKTGWFVGADGKWRFEISNDDLELKIIGLVHRNKTSVLLDDLIWSEKLFDAYPDLKWMNVELKNIEEGYVGQYDPNYDMINLSYDLFDNPDVLKDVLVHEIQHAIQRRESFAKGTSEEYWKMQIANGFDSRKKEDIKKEEDLQKEYEKYRKNNNELFNDVLDLIASTPDIPRGEINWETLESVEEDPVEWQEFDAKRDALVEKHGDKMFEFWDIVNKLDDVRKQGRTARELYLNTAGEIEARDAASRRKMTAEERRNRMPVVNEDAVIAEGNPYYAFSESDADPKLLKEFNNWLNNGGKLPQEGYFTILSETPQVMKKHGAPNLPIIMSEDVLIKFTGGKHSVSLDAAATLPKQLEEPVMLFKGSVKNSYVALTSMQDKSGNDVIVAIHLNRYQQRLRINRIASIYGKNNIENYVDTNIKAGNLLDADTKKAPMWFTTRGLQLPKVVQTIIGVSNNSISDSYGKSNNKFSIGRSKDAAYIDAVNRGDMGTAQRLVREAANIAGFTSPKLHHGTKSFGFTQLRTKDLDIFEWSPFFATPDPNLAETYSGETERRQLRGGYPKATQEQIDEHLAEYYAVLKKRIRAIDKHLSKPALPRANDAKRRSLMKDARNELANMVEAQDAKTLSEAYNRYIDAVDALEKTAMLPAEEALFEFDEVHKARWEINRIISAEEVFITSKGKLVTDENKEELERRGIDISAINDDEFLDYVKKYIDNDYEILDEEALKKLRTDSYRELLKTADKLSEVVFQKSQFKKDIEKAVKLLRDMPSAKSAKELEEMYNEYSTTVDMMRDNDKEFPFDDSVFDQFIPIVISEQPLNAYLDLQRFGYTDLVFYKNESSFYRYLTPQEASVELATPGIYSFYANLDGMFEIDGEGKNWNHIDGSKIGKEGYTKTRDVALYARNNGYKGVIIKNIYDSGGQTDYYEPGDIYIFFEPASQVKSADTVTYDDNGDIIPLSERFNEENNDIRWSVGSQNTEKKQKTAKSYLVGDTVSYLGERAAVVERRHPKGEELSYTIELENGDRLVVGADELEVGVTPQMRFDELPDETQEAWHEPPADWDMSRQIEDVYAEPITVSEFLELLYENGITVSKRTMNTWFRDHGFYEKRKKKNEKDRLSEKGQKSGMFKKEGKDIMITEEGQEYFLQTFLHADKETVDDLLESGKIKLPTAKTDKKSPLEERAYVDMANEYEDEIFDTGIDYWWATLLTGKGVTYSKDYARNFDAAAQNNPEARKYLQKYFVRPLETAKADYASNVRDKLESIKAKMAELGIQMDTEKASAVQWIGEGQYQDKYGDLHKYTLENLKEEFPDDWENIKKAEEFFREMYDQYLKDINQAREKIYPHPLEDAQDKMAAYETRRDRAAERIADQRAIIADIEKVLVAKKAEILKKKRKDTKVYADLQNSIRYNEERLARAKEHLNDYIDRKNKYDVLANEIRAAIDSGDILRNKRIIPRKDYFHHFQELTVGLGDVFSMSNNTSEIDPRLEGTSGYTEPRSKFSGVTLHRKHGRYKADAIEGMVRYVQTGEYMIHIDPVISEFRNHIVGMAKVTKDSRNANKLIRWLVQWTNDLAGKTNPADRFIQDVIGRETMKKIKWINSRAKANAVVGNLSSASAQFFNFPNLQAYVNDPKAYTAGLRDLFRFIRRDKDTRLLMRQSGFLNERYLDDAINALETKTKDKISHAAQWTLVVGDRYTSAMVWFTAYNDAVNKGKKRPIEYADNITRRCVAGRGIGEIPLAQKSNITQIFAPFQIEVNNAYQLYKEKIVGAATGRTEKDKLVSAGQFGLILVMNFLMNTVTDLVLHRRVVYDPIYVFLQCLSDWKNGDDDEEEKNIAEKFAELLGRQAGEIISNIPYGSLLAYYGINWSWARENIFGDQDPTRFGVSNIALDWAAGFLESLFTGKNIVDDVLSFGTNFLMPFGGKQTERTLQGLVDSGILPELKVGWKEGVSFGWKKAPGSYDKNGQLQFPLKSPISYDEDGKLQFGFDSVGDFGEWLSLLAFGKYATDEGQKYLGKDYEASTLLQNIFGFNKTKERTTLSERATEVVVTLAKNGSDVFEVYDTVRELQDAENIFEKRNILAEADLTDAEKAKILLGYVVSEDNYESTLAKMNGVISVGLGVDDYLKIANLYSLINDSEEYQTATEKTLLFNTELASMGYTSEQIQGVNEVMAYFSHIPADTSKFDELIGLGLSTDTTLAIQKTLGELEPLEGETQVSSLQKAEAIAGMGLSKDEETAAMAIALDDNTYVKYKVVTDYGVDAQIWVDLQNALVEANANNPDELKRNKSYDKEEKKAALDSLDVSNETRAALWQILDNQLYSTDPKHNTAWKAGRNPYSSSVGAQVVEACIEGKSALAASKETDETESAYTSPVSGDIVINSKYGYRIHPISGEWKMHHGLDIDGEQGDPVFAVAEGTVVKTVNSNKGYGNYVIIEHADGTQTLYGHMYSYGVEVGQTVSQGEQIGEVGSTGGTTGPHLHFEVRVDGQSVNPQTIFDFTGEGIVTESDPNYAPIVSGGGSSGGGSSGGSSRSGSTASVGSRTSEVASNRRSGGLTLPSVGGSGGNGGGSRASTPVAGMSTSAPTFGARGLYLPKASDYTPNRRSISSSVATTQRTGRTGGSFWDDNILS